MSEELNRQEAELNEAALEQAIGGVGGNTEECKNCNANQDPNLCTAEGSDVADYMHWGGRIKDWRRCPFHKTNRGAPGSAG